MLEAEGCPCGTLPGLEKVLPLDPDPIRTQQEAITATILQRLQVHPEATLQQLCEYVQRDHGVTLKAPAMCVIRQQLGLSPDTQQSRAAKARSRGGYHYREQRPPAARATHI